MKSHEFLLFAILCAVLHVAAPSAVYFVAAHVLGICGLFASYKAFRMSLEGGSHG